MRILASLACVLALAACGHDSANNADASAGDDGGGDGGGGDDAPAGTGRGTVTNIRDLAACPAGAPAGATCKQVTVTNCPGITTESIDAIVATRPAVGTLRGTIVHFSGGGGEGFQGGAGAPYETAGFRNLYVAWLTDWEQTASSGIKTAGCRPATILEWAFVDPTIHNGSRTTGFCGEGFSGGSGQLGYALAHYGMGDFLDYVNELSGPPFARIDLGCDGDAPATATVCGVTDTMRLPRSLDAWENIAAPLQCGSKGVPAAELARWKADSIAVGGAYDYPKTNVGFFDCTNQATAVTAMAQIYFNEISAAEGNDTARASFHCYSQADGCQGEGLGITGNREATQAMIANCVPRH